MAASRALVTSDRGRAGWFAPDDLVRCDKQSVGVSTGLITLGRLMCRSGWGMLGDKRASFRGAPTVAARSGEPAGDAAERSLARGLGRVSGAGCGGL